MTYSEYVQLSVRRVPGSTFLVAHEISRFIKSGLQLPAHFGIDAHIFHRLPHALHPLITLAIADGKGHVTLAQPRVAILFHIELRSPSHPERNMKSFSLETRRSRACMARIPCSEYLEMVRLVFGRMGVHWQTAGTDLIVPFDQKLEIEPDLGNAIPEISVMPWPAFPTDLMSIAIVIATQCNGSVLFHDWMYPSRMFFTDKLVNMGAHIVLCDPHRCIVQGPTRLYGEILDSPDIRAGMALVLAALAAKGESTIRNVGQIDRGFERVEEKLRLLGADIERA